MTPRPTARLTRVEQQALLRQRILDAALGVFRRVGFPSSTIQEIADLAGCTRGSVYLHFRSREALLVAVFEEHLDAQVAAFRARIDEAADVEALIRLLLAVGPQPGSSHELAAGDLGKIVQSFRVDGDEEMIDRLRHINRAVEGAYGALVAKICDLRGIAAPIPVVDLAHLVVALRQHAIERAALEPEHDAFTALSTSVNLLISGTPTPALSVTTGRKARS